MIKNNDDGPPNDEFEDWQDAVYRQQIVPSYQENPFIEALPDILSNKEAYHAMKYLPPFDPLTRELDDHLRNHFIFDIRTYYQPLSMHLELQSSLSLVIRSGYIGRNPLHRNYLKKLDEHLSDVKGRNDPKYGKLKATAPSLYICGFSGVGKTSGVLAPLLLYPQVIRHQEYKDRIFNFLQIVWLFVDCPHDGSIKSLCLEIFEAIDNLLGTNYLYLYGHKSNPQTDKMIIDIRRLVRLHGIGCIVIDEIHQLSIAKGQGITNMLNFFVNLVNRSGLPIILIGNPKALPIFTKEFQQARRASGIGDIKWGAMTYNPDDDEDEWRILFERIWQYQYTRKSVPLTQDMLKALHVASGGIVDFAIKAFILAQFRAIHTQSEILTPDLILSVAADSFSFSNEILDILRTNDFEKMAQVPDLKLYDLEAHYKQLSSNRAKESMSDIIRAERINTLTSRGAAIQPNGEYQVPPPKAGKGRRQNTVKLAELLEGTYPPDDLRILYAHSQSVNKPFLEALTKAGHAKNVDEFLHLPSN
jgi:hypothetical protein